MTNFTAELISKLKEIYKENISLKQQITQYKIQQQTIQQHFNAAKQQILQHRQNLVAKEQSLTEQRETFIKQFKQALADERVQLQLQQLQMEHEQLWHYQQAQIQATVDVQVNVENQIYFLQNKCELSQNQLVELNEVPAEKQSELAQSEQNIPAADDELDGLDNWIAEQKNLLKKYQDDVQQTQNEHACIKQNCVAQQVEYERLTQEISIKQQKYDDLQQDYKLLQNQLVELNELLAEKQSELAQSEQNIQTAVEPVPDDLPLVTPTIASPSKPLITAVKHNVKGEVVNKAIDYLMEQWKNAHIELLEGNPQKAEQICIELNGLSNEAFVKVANMWIYDPKADKEQFKDGIIKFNKLFTSYNDVLLGIKKWQPRKNVFEKLGKEAYINYLKDMVSGLKKPRINKSDFEKLAGLQLSPVATPFSKWLAEFLLMRDMFEIVARPLFRYAMSEQEYDELRDLFRQHNQIIRSNQARYVEWCACYCLAASEIYRREYAGGSWTWDLIDKQLSLNFVSQQAHYEIVSVGLNYWQRPLHIYGSNRTNYLGTLFAECGLPVKLLTSEDNVFGKLLEYGLAKYDESLQSYRPLERFLQEREQYLADTFRNEATISLLAETVRVLMNLAQTYDFTNEAEPVAYLDNVAQDWRLRFPFMLPEKHADNLINRWLGNAAAEQHKSAKQHFSCAHYVKNDVWQFTAVLGLPETFAFDVSGDYQGRTILQWALFEGEQAVERVGGTVFATLHEQTLSFRLPESKINVLRQLPDYPLSVRFFADGRLLYTRMLPETEIDTQSPCVFVKTDEQTWRLLANAEYIRVNEPYLARLPIEFRLPENAVGVYQDNQANWLTAQMDLHAKTDENRIIHIDYTDKSSANISLRGELFYRYQHANGNVAPIYRGFPSIHTPEDLPCTHIEIQQQKYANMRTIEQYGTFQAAFFSNGTCLLRRKITVLPKDFQCRWEKIATQKQPAQLSVLSNKHLFCELHGEDLIIEPKHQGVSVQHTSALPPEHCIVRVGSNEQIAASLRLQFAFEGAYLLNEMGLLDEQHLTLSQLLGKVVSIYSSQKYIEMNWRLLPENINRSFRIPMEQSGAQIHLHSFKTELLQLLACSNSQDSYIEWTFSNSKLTLRLSHYQGVIQWNNQIYQHGQWVNSTDTPRQHFVIKQNAAYELACANAEIEIMRLDTPKPSAQKLPESQYLGNHRYDLLPEQYGEGLWLIYPALTSPIAFRPTIFDNSETPFVAPEQIDDLHTAARAFHPKLRPNAIADVIAIMATQPEHSGWEYFAALKEHFAHLPLSVFKVWKELARQPESLAMAVWRLGLDNEFCERIRHELAVVWEWQPERALRNALNIYQPYFENKFKSLGIEITLPEDVLPMNIICYSPILREHIFKGYLNDENQAKQAIRYKDIAYPRLRDEQSFYTAHYNALRQIRRLPEYLCEPLQQWVNTQRNQHKWIVELSKTDYDRAVVWLPIFSAFVKVGKAKPQDLLREYNQMDLPAELLHCFYEVYRLDPGWFDYICATVTSEKMANETERS